MRPFKVTSILPGFLFALLAGFDCTHSSGTDGIKPDENKPEVVVKKREDGTLSSINQVDDMGRVHGIRITYFADGKTMYSKFEFKHGIKQGPSIRYYNNGQIFEHTTFEEGKKHGPSRKYHKSGELLARCDYEHGIVLPGLKEYHKDGSQVISYPEVKFREIDHLASRKRIDLEMSCISKVNGVKYFLIEEGQEAGSRTYLNSENGTASMQFYVKPGETLDKKLEFIAEIPTEMGNIMAKKLSYHLIARNTAIN